MPANSALEIEDLSYRWPGNGNWSLSLPSLNIDQGERVFLFGPSGSGKSTLLSLVAGVLAPDSGNIRINGNTLNTLKAAHRDRFRADHLGLIFQLFNLVPYLSVIENVILPCRFSRMRRERVSGSLESEAHRLLDHLDLAREERDKPVSELSIGQQQRVAAARALIGSPGLIIADEPTSALDADRQEAFLNLLAAECEANGSSLLFVSHDQRLASRFDRRLDLLELLAGNRL